MNWKKVIIKENSSIKDAVINLNAYGIKICLVVNKQDELLGTLTDGDIRRGFLKGYKLSDKVSKVINKNFFSINKGALIKDSVYEKMKKFNNNYLPVLKKKKIVDLFFYEGSFYIKKKINSNFIIMAGGYGKRLYPLTRNIPKPMIKIKNKPILEHIIISARNEGFYKFTLVVHHLKDKIVKYFKDGSKLGVNIDYIIEKKPLSTAGGLSLLNKKISKNIIITNADMLSNLSFKELLNFHISNKSDASVSVKVMNFKENYGLVDLKGIEIDKFNEKPTVRRYVNCGVYALSSKNLKYLKKDQEIDMISFLEKLKYSNKKLIAFPIYEGWLDLGKKKNLAKFLKNKK